MQIKANEQLIDWASIPNHIGTALGKGYSIALWRTPSGKGASLIAGEAAELPLSHIKEPGFLIAPFVNSGHAFFITPADDYLVPTPGNTGRLMWHSCEGDHESTSRKEFSRKVRFAVEQIKGSAFDKVVVSRKKVVPFEGGPGLLEVFEALCETHPEAFVYLVSTPKYGTWAGATPELLLGFSGEQLQTVALAGTVSDPRAGFSEKDEEEHQLVEKYIEDCFDGQNLEYHKKGPKRIQAGHIYHLRTDYATVPGQEGGGWRNILQLLHPTPAVGGFRPEITGIFIRNEEGFERELYTGYLGPLHHAEAGQLYVNLRCMQIQPDSAVLYAGTGIVRGSRAEQEWEETSQKMAVLEKVLEEQGLFSAE